MRTQRRCGAVRLFVVVALVSRAVAADTAHNVPAAARATLGRAIDFYHHRAASHGGYVYYYSDDLSQRWGEGRASADTIFVQPPGTPSVGLAYLKAYEATGEQTALEAARAAAEALVYGQLQSGGWTQVIQFAGGKKAGRYRNGHGGSWNASSLDDGQTQSALKLLALADRALEFKHAAIHEAARYGFDALLKAQFPNGAFPQVWTGPVESRPIVRAHYPDYDWRAEGRVKNYWDQYTLNDGLAGTVAETLIVADGVYDDPRYRGALARLGDFLLLAQMPEPQPAWCQQYSAEMAPIWARKFEPPAVSGWESQDAIRTLITIARYTGEQKYLAPIPRALEYLRGSLLADGRVARFYELRTNTPLYMTADYQLTYDDRDVPPHYGWKQPALLDELEQAYRDARDGKPPALPAKLDISEARIREIIEQLDPQGRWVSTYAGERLVGQPKFAPGFRYISSEIFCRNVEAIGEYLSQQQR
ncbi:MAG TPA: pectate lyase [Pirellulales bacterium]|nr:pectate lyase [Pirellulales bacterium]